MKPMVSDKTTMPDEVRTLDAAARITRTRVAGDATLCWREWDTRPDSHQQAADAPLLLLHGSHGSWMHWLRNIPVLAAHRRLIVPDIPGNGESDALPDLESHVDHARALVEGLRQILPTGQVDIVAFSLGSTLACHMSVLDPALVRRIVIIDAGGLGTTHQAAPLRPIRGARPDQIDAINRHNLGVMMIHDPARIDETAVAITAYCGKRARTRIQHSVLPDRLLKIAREVAAPIDVIWAEHDILHPDPELNCAVIRAIQPEARLRVVEDAGHWCMYEQPERFNRAALDLLGLPLHAGPGGR